MLNTRVVTQKRCNAQEKLGDNVQSDEVSRRRTMRDSDAVEVRRVRER